MITPPHIQQGDKIGIVAPAKQIDLKQYAVIENFIKNEGFIPVMGKTTQLQDGPFAGNDTERASDLQNMIDNPEIKAILCVRGGYGTIRIIENINPAALLEHPKWIVGFSDITILHAYLLKHEMASIHGAMPVNYTPDRYNKGVKQLFETLQGNLPQYQLPDCKWNKYGSAQGKMVGGNLAILCSLLGTPWQVDTKESILFIEEVGEHLYRFDRMIYQLKQSGSLNNINGLVVGGLTDIKDREPYFKESVEEIILKHLPADIPVAFNFPAGHIENNQPLILGKQTTFTCDEKGAEIC